MVYIDTANSMDGMNNGNDITDSQNAEADTKQWAQQLTMFGGSKSYTHTRYHYNIGIVLKKAGDDSVS